MTNNKKKVKDSNSKEQQPTTELSQYDLLDENFEKWTPEELADYIQRRESIGNYAELFRDQKIDGSIAHSITDDDLKEMGVSAIGDRKRICEALESLKQAKHQKDREKVLWVGREEMYWGGCDKCWQTCCGLCKEDPDKYTLMYNFLEIKERNYNRCGGCKCCYGHNYSIDTIDLSNVDDVDVDGVSPSCFCECCCCAIPHEHIKISVNGEQERKMMRLPKGTGEAVARKIKNQVEIMQVMERS